MGWFNVFGLAMVAVILIPGIVYAIKCRDGFENKWKNKGVGIAEQIGRSGCLGFMMINVPGTCFGWWSDEAFALYLIVDAVLAALYCLIRMLCFKKSGAFRAPSSRQCCSCSAGS